MNMAGYGFVSVAIGAVIGAWLRWGLGIALNPIVPTLPLGTLAANLLGGYLMGLALGFFEHFQALSPEVRLLITTGFLGSLTTFSTFSAETTTLLLRQEYGWTALIVAAHLIGTLVMTVVGIATVTLLRSWFGSRF
jgi:fluoride exporter